MRIVRSDILSVWILIVLIGGCCRLERRLLPPPCVVHKVGASLAPNCCCSCCSAFRCIFPPSYRPPLEVRHPGCFRFRSGDGSFADFTLSGRVSGARCSPLEVGTALLCSNLSAVLFGHSNRCFALLLFIVGPLFCCLFCISIANWLWLVVAFSPTMASVA